MVRQITLFAAFPSLSGSTQQKNYKKCSFVVIHRVGNIYSFVQHVCFDVNRIVRTKFEWYYYKDFCFIEMFSSSEKCCK